jgi:hypothetical protein
MLALRRIAVVLSWLVLLPASAYAQATLAGTVRDASGGVLPGVTVEASSPALLEKARSAFTDGTGQYRLPSLPPGVYSVTFTLQGFTTFKRDEVEVGGVGVVTINAELRVGAVAETITVTGETPVVDIQSTTRQEVLNADTVASIPVSRGYNAILAAIPSVTGGSQQVDLAPTMRIFTSHGGRGNEGHVQADGLDVGAAFNGGGVSGYIMDTTNAAELQFTTSGGLGDVQTGGINLNIIPKTGGNTFRGQLFGSSAGQWSQGENLDEDLETKGVLDPAALFYTYDVSGSVGGPIKRDKIWFYGTIRAFGSANAIPGAYGNANAGDPTKWTYVQDRGISVRTANGRKIYAGRITAQVTPKNKIGFYWDYQKNCDQSAYVQDQGCRGAGEDWIATGGFGAFQSPEAFSTYADTNGQVKQLTWTSTMSSKLLFEAGFSSYTSRWGWMKPPYGSGPDLTTFTPVTAVIPTFVIFRGNDNFFNNFQSPNVWRASASYVTGAHSMKFGYQGAYLIEEIQDFSNSTGFTYTTLFAPTPSSFTMRIAPWQMSNRTSYAAFYAQDQWTLGKLTLQGALRYDKAWSWFPTEHNGAPNPGPFNPQPITFQGQDMVSSYHDITPRVGVAYDLFGNGKTSLKFNIGRYLQNANNQENYTIANPALDGRNGRRGPTYQTTVTRNWFDADGDYVIDGDVNNPNPNGEILSGSGNFNNPNATTQVDPGVLSGWGVRPADWQIGASVQHEIAPRTSLEVGYYRRWFQNFFVYDNVLLDAGDFDQVTITAPTHPDLTTSGQPVTFLALRPGNSYTVQNRYRQEGVDGFPKRDVYWHGVDVTVNARLRNGLVFQGGTSTGRGVLDACDLAAALPEFYNPILTNPAALGGPNSSPWQQVGACKQAENWLTQFRGLASYTIPKIDVLLSGVIRMTPNATTGPTDTTVGTNGTSLSAQYTVTGAAFQTAAGRPLVGSTSTTVNLLVPGTQYGERINQVDLRVAKVLRLGRTQTNVGFDLYNLFNSNAILVYQTNFGVDGSQWLWPTGGNSVLNPRFIRFNVTVDF